MTTERRSFLDPLYTTYTISHKYNITKEAINMQINNIGSLTNGDQPKKEQDPKDTSMTTTTSSYSNKNVQSA